MKNKLCGAFLLAVAVLHCVLGDYELEVRLHEYNNPTSKLHLDNDILLCCDDNVRGDVCVDADRCDNYFVHCFRELGSDGPCISNEFNSSIFDNNDSIQFSSDESSIDVPMVGAWEGIQFYTAVMDDDAGDLQLIDSFTIDLNTNFLIPGAGFTARTVYNGTFNLGYLELSFQVSCAENFFGSNCATECIPRNNLISCNEDGTIVCLPGFTGERCSVEIDECQGIDCSGNGQCIDGLANFSCDCDAGFTGERCETDIDDCASANCSENSRCVDMINSFTCVCSADFTGTLCEDQLPPEVDSPININAIIGGVVGAVIGAIALVLILILVLMIVMRKSEHKESGFPLA